MKKPNKTSYAILGMLSIAPMSGYDIRQVMQQSTANFWSESDGQLYPALTNLTTHGLISCEIDHTGAREKKIYHLTSKGSTELKAWLALEPETHTVRNEFILKLFFGANVSPDVNLEHLQLHRHQAKAGLTQLLETKANLAAKESESPHLPYWDITLEYGIQIAKTKLQWCDDMIRELQKLKRGEKV